MVLKFAEVYWNSPGGRVFDVWAEGVKAFSSLDIFALAGRNRPYDISLPVIITDGQLDIRFSTVKNYAGVSAIVVRKR